MLTDLAPQAQSVIFVMLYIWEWTDNYVDVPSIRNFKIDIILL